MTPDRTREKAMTDYRQSLILALRLKDVPGDRIGEIVAEVESHVAETGENPAEAFGSPRAYAAHLSAGHQPEPWWHLAATAVPAAVAGWFLAQGALALLLGQTYLDRPGWLWVVLALLIGIPVGVSVTRRSTRVRDPRTGADMVPTSFWGLAALVGLPLALIVTAWGAIEILGRLT